MSTTTAVRSDDERSFTVTGTGVTLSPSDFALYGDHPPIQVNELALIVARESFKSRGIAVTDGNEVNVTVRGSASKSFTVSAFVIDERGHITGEVVFWLDAEEFALARAWQVEHRHSAAAFRREMKSLGVDPRA